MNKQQYNSLISESVRLQALIKRHNVNIKAIEKDLQGAMLHDKIDVFQGEKGTVTYRGNTSKATVYNLMKLFKKLKIGLFLKLVTFNATQAKPLIKDGTIDSRLLDSITTVSSKTTPAKIKIQAI